MSRKVQPVHADGYQWAEGLISTPGAWSLLDPDGFKIAHAYRCNDKTWSAVWDDGGVIADGLAASGDALRIIDNAARPCSWVNLLPEPPCDLDRAPGSTLCPIHVERDRRDHAASDDMDRLVRTES